MRLAVLRLVIARIATALLTLVFVSAVVFVCTESLPGDVAEVVLGQNATPEPVAGLRQALHLDTPAYVRYFLWLGALLSGDPGRSLVNNLPVAELIASRLPNSLMLAGMTAIVCVPIALTLGIVSAVWRGGVFDRAIGFLTMSIVSARASDCDVMRNHLRRPPALVPGAIVRRRYRVTRPLFPSVRTVGIHAQLRPHCADNAHDARCGDRHAALVLCRDGSAERCATNAHLADSRVAERNWPHRKCDRVESVVSSRWRYYSRDHL